MITLIWLTLLMKIVFWGSLLVVSYTYIGYPLLIAVWAYIGGARPVQRAPIRLPISIIISAYNEEAHIGAKLTNCCQLNYPQELIQLIVVSDGSTDQTETIVTQAQTKQKNISLVRLSHHRGKAAALNIAVGLTYGEILIFTDARQMLAPEAISSLVANFADPSVGAVSGELLFVDEEKQLDMSGVGIYWKYEKWLRQTESAIHSMCGATGALYAIRRKLFPALPANLILDDVLIPLAAPLAGYRLIFDGNAHVYDRLAPSTAAEFTRKVRTLYGNYQLLVLEPRIWKPWRNPIFLQYFSHKICRLIAPFCLITMLAANLFLLKGIYLLFLVLQLTWYLLALVGFLKIETTSKRFKERPCPIATSK